MTLVTKPQEIQDVRQMRTPSQIKTAGMSNARSTNKAEKAIGLVSQTARMFSEWYRVIIARLTMGCNSEKVVHALPILGSVTPTVLFHPAPIRKINDGEHK
jgi:hypothetical protein